MHDPQLYDPKRAPGAGPFVYAYRVVIARHDCFETLAGVYETEAEAVASAIRIYRYNPNERYIVQRFCLALD